MSNMFFIFVIVNLLKFENMKTKETTNVKVCNLAELQMYRNNVNNLFILGYYSDIEYKTQLDKLDNLELFFYFNKIK
jgi:hypothetical protein